MLERAKGMLRFDRGTLLVREDAARRIRENLGGRPCAELRDLREGLVWDPRVDAHRAPAYHFAGLVRALEGRPVALRDVTRRVYAKDVELRPYQEAALESWGRAGRRGVVVLPTGAGKTHLGLAAASRLRVPTLVVVPTRVLLHQWYERMSEMFDAKDLGMLGDGHRRISAVTVATFESALRAMPRIGHRYALLVVDEAHHFGHGSRTELLHMAIAPFRLGLTATPSECGDHRETLDELVGEICSETAIEELRGRFLADFDHTVSFVDLRTPEQEQYDRLVRRFRHARNIASRGERGLSWAALVARVRTIPGGEEALLALRRAEHIVSYPSAKAEALRCILRGTRGSRVLCFTADNRSAYAVAREHLLWPITCDIKKAERDEALDLFRAGKLRGIVSSRVLNEGYDVPDADVAIIVGATLGRREHVQRIGRVLRPSAGKRATVIELVCRGTMEERRSKNRQLASGQSKRQPLGDVDAA